MIYFLKVIFPYLIALYFLDCIIYLNKHQFVIETVFGKIFRLKKYGIHIVGLLPLSQIYLSQNLPIVLSTEGVYYVSNDALNEIGIYKKKDYSFLPYREIDKLEIDEKNIKIKNKTIIKGPSNLYAIKLLDLLQKIKAIEPQGRKITIKNYLSNLYNIREVKRIKKDSAPQILNLYIITSIFFLLVFIITPIFLYTNIYLYANIYVLVIYILIVYIYILFRVKKLNNKLYHPNKGIRTISFLSLVFSPINAIHASIYITKNLYCSFDLITVAAVFLEGNALKKIIRKEYFFIKNTKIKSDDRGWKEYWDMKEEYLLKIIKSASITLNEIVSIPDKQDDDAEKYCPICLTEYTSEAIRCSDCETELEKYSR